MSNQFTTCQTSQEAQALARDIQRDIRRAHSERIKGMQPGPLWLALTHEMQDAIAEVDTALQQRLTELE